MNRDGSGTAKPFGLRRSVALFQDFLVEQHDPGRFYGALARDTVALLDRYEPLTGAVVLDVGAGPGYFRDAFARAGGRYIALEADAGEFARSGASGSAARARLVGDAQQLPIAEAAVDIAFSSNVVEHVPDPERMWHEMVRVTRPGGLVVISFTNWLSPWGGHETAPWHYLGGGYAARRYTLRHGHPPKNLVGQTLFAHSIGRVLDLVRSDSHVDIVDARPRYLPDWARALVRVPGVREVLTWNLWVAARRR